jgi:hypothetical protein
MTVLFDEIAAMLQWETIYVGRTWSAHGPAAFICLIGCNADGDGKYYSAVLNGTELFLSSETSFYTLDGAKAWCVDKVAGLWRQ